ncbi:ferredoxin-NADP reductase [Microbacteriaceae bacterium SG_E_30_P1]|uniref:Ferredoxin-NADP reductase n=1 Tax=Antiquaquibacter oligotrophicus TaxID=2880260 RepID=A0ABT6KNH2_9MICO|nr:PDR/VanB family oxidoreductase [Antiquaquibacter oligotrophicus]MDH6181551.1 ferredoxin-NADP reductase [Antiquaquibacter oligotrophicus]UDF12760.1 PDR/VanB family oxidoreductase [Antiquaquibacter oligotrophicus]
MTAHVAGEFDVVIAGMTRAADDVVLFDLALPSGVPLPRWQPGSHIDVLLPDGDARQYSLCGVPGEATWRIGVLREADGRGGSLWLHDRAVGDTITIAGPRNHFEFVPERGTSYLFIAGGIGITPISAMVASAASAGVDYRLEYAGRSRSTMALLDELSAAHPDRVSAYPADEGLRLDLEALFADLKPFTTTYCCGPARLIAAVEEAARGRQLKVERFEPKEFGPPVLAGPFEVELAYSGLVLEVPPERSVLDVIEEAGVLVLSSCREGTCGTCETPVMEGEVDHRDSILTPDEQAANTVMYPCVSRAACPRLLLEL